MIIDIYTDGGCYNSGPRKGDGAWYYIILQDNKIVKETGGTLFSSTSSQCEMIAIIKALIEIQSMPEANYTIYSDSLYCVDGICNHLPKWRKSAYKKGTLLNIHLWTKINALKDDVQFQWLKGHAGNIYNTYVDKQCTKLLRGRK